VVDIQVEWPGKLPKELADGDEVLQQLLLDNPSKLYSSTERIFPLRYYYDISCKQWKQKA
jgi:hypothetical protein